jgi:hypothetical protein
MSVRGATGNPDSLIEKTVGALAPFVGFLWVISRRVGTLISAAEYRKWAKERGNKRFFRTRSALWMGTILPILEQDPSDSPLLIAEFGVAYGDATSWWLKRVTNSNLSYHGFDRFTGLPRDWRGYREGTFDAGGEPPLIDDTRVRWHIGDIENTITEVNWSSVEGRKLFMFDLDVFDPSLVVWNSIKASLRTGDLIYFDELFDSDERLLLTAFIDKELELRLLGISPFGGVFQIA